MRFLLVVISLWMLECSLASDLECSYSFDAYGYYTCVTLKFKLETENSLIDTVKGQHLPGKEQTDVEGLLIVYSKNKFLSSDIFKKFPNLKELGVMFHSVEKIVEGHFHGAQYLEHIYINNNNILALTDNIFSGATKLIRIEMKTNGIISISNQTFTGSTTLQHIDLDHNHLKSLPEGIFDDLINLKSVSFYGNILDSLDGDLYKYNLNLKKLWLANNHLSVIGSNMLTNLKGLEFANFYNNPCISATLNSVNINILNDMIAKCTESNKPEQKLKLAESKYNETADSLRKVNTELSKSITEQLQEIQALKQNVEVLHGDVNTLNKNNQELNTSVKEQLQENGALKHNFEALHQKMNSDAESNRQILTTVNEELHYCQDKIQKSKFAFKCFH